MSESEMPSVSIEGGPTHGATPDSALPGWLGSLPEFMRPYASLARWDRPVGIWLLALPCWIGLAFTRIGMGWHWIDLWWAALFFIGAIAMRGAGCTWNDIMDQEMDAGVERTAARPLPSGQVSTNEAYIWLGAQLGVGFLVWLCLPTDAKVVALLAIPLVGAYPFMKRLTWWPQAWLGFTFNWGVLVAAATVSYVGAETVILWLALAAWTIAYDTIYAMQDVEDDALLDVKSTARLFGERVVLGAFSFHMIAAAVAGFATWSVGAGRLGALTMMAFLAHGIWQALRLRKDKNANALSVFKSNVWAGLILLLGLSFAAIIGGDRTPTKMTAWQIMSEPGKMEREKARLRENIPDWFIEKEEPKSVWSALPAIFGGREDSEPETEEQETDVPELPNWLFDTSE